jgi:hypothetical protein
MLSPNRQSGLYLEINQKLGRRFGTFPVLKKRDLLHHVLQFNLLHP